MMKTGLTAILFLMKLPSIYITMARDTVPSPTLQKVWYINSISHRYIWYIRVIYLSCPI